MAIIGSDVPEQTAPSPLEGLRRGLEANDASSVRPLAEFAAEMRAKYTLPVHLSDEEIKGEVMMSNLKPLPQFESVIPENWKEAVYGPDGSGCP